MLTGFIANLLGAFAAILALAPVYIRSARESECKSIVKSEWVSYMGGCALTAYYSWQFSFLFSCLLEKGG